MVLVVSEDGPIALVDEQGDAMPVPAAVESDTRVADYLDSLPTVELTRTVARSLEPHASTDGSMSTAAQRLTFGERFPLRSVVAAAAVAREWRDEIAGALPSCPRLRAIDPSNVGVARLPAPYFAEVLVGLERADGGVAWFAYGRDPGAPEDALTPAVRVGVLAKVLVAFPGLSGVRRGDLRMTNRWRSSIAVEDAERPGPR